MQHSFDIHIAEKYGVNAAILLNNIQHWIIKNRANSKHQHDGRTWTYNSIKAFTELFPYMTAKQIRTALDKLVEEGVLMKGNFNETPYDRTCWYAFVDEETLCPQRQMKMTKKANENDPEGEPIPDINTDSKPSNFSENPKKKLLMKDSIKLSPNAFSTLLQKEIDGHRCKEEISKTDWDHYISKVENWNKRRKVKTDVEGWVSYVMLFVDGDMEKGGIKKANKRKSSVSNQYEEFLQD